MLFWKKFIFFLLLYSCVPTTRPTATSSGVTPTAVSIDRIVTSGNLLVINGSGLQGFNEVAITDSSNSFEKKFKVTEVTPTRIVSENVSPLSLPVNELLELVLSSASGQTIETVIPITFSLQPGSVSTAAIQPEAITATKFKGVAGNPPAGTVPEWDGISQFNFVYPTGGGGGGGGGSVTSVGRGVGIFGSGVPITSAGTISVDIGTKGDSAVTKIPFFTHEDRLVISKPAELYFTDSAFPDRNFVIYNDQFFSIGRVATATGVPTVPTDYLTINETGTVDIPIALTVNNLSVGGKSVCYTDGSNCALGGDVSGPLSSDNGAVAFFSGTSGKTITGGTKLANDLVTGPPAAIAGNLAQLDATGKIISDTLIAAANVPTMAANATGAFQPILSVANGSKTLISPGYTIPSTVCGNGLILKSDGANFVCLADLVGTGTVVGPSSPTVGNLSTFNSASGTSIADSGLALANVVNMVPIIPPTINQLIVAAGAQYVQASNIFSTDLVTMSAPTNASSTDLILTSAGVNKTAKVSTISINNVVTMSTPTTNAAEVLISDAMGSRTAIGSGLAIANVPTMATNSAGADRPILSVTNTKALIAAPYTIPATLCASGEVFKSNGTTGMTCATDNGTGATPGDVMGPASATLTNLASFDLASGKRIADSGISSANVVTMTAIPAVDLLFSSSGTNKVLKNTGVLSTNLVTMTSNATATDYVLISSGNNKIAKASTLLSTDVMTMTSNALLAGNVLTSAGTNKSAQATSIVATDLVTATANFSMANRVAISAGGTRALTETGYAIPTGVCPSGFGLVSDGTDFECSATASGNVLGPAAATDNAIARFDLATGKIIQDSGVLIDDTNNITGLGTITGTNFSAGTNTGHGATYGCFSNDVFANSQTGYALCQQDGGDTLLNAPTGKAVQQRINNTIVTSATSTGFNVTGTLSSTGNATVGGTLGVTGNTSLTGTLGVTGASTFSGATIVNNNFTAKGVNTNTPLALTSAVNFMTGLTSAGGVSAGQTSANLAFEWGAAGGGFRHYITTTHNSVAPNNLNSFRFYLNTGALAADSSAPGTGNTLAMSITPVGVGILNDTPTIALDVTGSMKANGQISSGATTITTNAVDWNSGNIISTNYDCPAAINLANLKIGGTYTLIVTGTGTAQCTFANPTGTDAGAVTYRFRPANTVRVANTHSIYTLMRVGTTVYVSWGSNF